MSHIWFIVIYLPVVGAIIGWVCKWVAIKMLWHPEKFVGIGPIGWQGVIQRRAPKFAAGVADTVSRTGVTVEGLLERVDAEALVARIAPALDAAAPSVVGDVAEGVQPGLWQSLPEPAQQMALGHVRAEVRRIAVKLVSDLKPLLVQAIDVRKLVVAQLSGQNANRLAKLFQRVGAHELVWVIRYGAILGFLIGCLEVAGFTLLERWWILPIVGALDGVVNNWLAIQMIFRPLERTRYLGVFPYQGLFPARQKEISAEYAAMMASEVLSPRDLVDHVREEVGPQALAAAFVTLEAEIDAQIALLAGMVGQVPTPEMKTRALAAFAALLPQLAPALQPEIESYLAGELEVAATIERELAAMPRAEFEEVLRGIFEEDEKTIIIIGGFLGGLIGMVQAGVMLAL